MLRGITMPYFYLKDKKIQKQYINFPFLLPLRNINFSSFQLEKIKPSRKLQKQRKIKPKKTRERIKIKETKQELEYRSQYSGTELTKS